MLLFFITHKKTNTYLYKARAISYTKGFITLSQANSFISWILGFHAKFRFIFWIDLTCFENKMVSRQKKKTVKSRVFSLTTALFTIIWKMRLNKGKIILKKTDLKYT